MKIWISVLLTCVYAFNGYGAELSSLALSAKSAILINGNTGAVLYKKNADQALYPASIVKIATALYVLKKKKNLDEIVIAKKEAIASISPGAKKQSGYRAPAWWLETDGSHIGIKKGEVFVLRDLLYAMLVSSANDAANVIAEHVGGTIPKFIDDLNAYLKSIGCKNTHLLNPHGFHHPEQHTTAYDMALITKEAMQIPFFREMVATTHYTIARTNFELERNLIQTNHLLRKGQFFYPKAIGVKTGTMTASGKNLVAAAQNKDRLLISVILGCETNGDRYQDTTKLFEGAFNQPLMRRYLLPKGSTSITKKISGGKGALKTYLPEGLYYDFYPQEEGVVKAQIKWGAIPLPIQKNQLVGVCRVVNGEGSVLQETPIYALEKLEPNIFYGIRTAILHSKTFRKCCLGAGFLLLCIYFLKKKRKRITS